MSLLAPTLRDARPSTPLTPTALASIVERIAASPDWLPRVRLQLHDRWYERLELTPDYDVWLLSWMPGQSTGFHDHGSSAGAFIVTSGFLEEHRPSTTPRIIPAGSSRAFGPNYAHDVHNASDAPAISIHAYSPPLTEMNAFDLDGDSLILRTAEPGHTSARWQNPAPQAQPQSIDTILAQARARLHRLEPGAAHDAITTAGAILVDIRPAAQRAAEGSIPNALVIERNVLEWRLDPASSARLPIATTHDLHVIIICSEGYTSSLAAAALQDLGIHRATDVIGGFHRWRHAGLPTVAPPPA